MCCETPCRGHTCADGGNGRTTEMAPPPHSLSAQARSVLRQGEARAQARGSCPRSGAMHAIVFACQHSCMVARAC